MEDGVDPVHGPDEAIPVADVTDQEPDVAPIAEALALVELLRLVPPEDPHDFRLEPEEVVDQARADRARTAGDQDSLPAEGDAGSDRESSSGIRRMCPAATGLDGRIPDAPSRTEARDPAGT
jgi:hypothetical protein